MRRRILSAASALLTAAAVMGVPGCGSSGKAWTYNPQVEGTVKIDGVPLAGVLVQFFPDDPTEQGPTSSATTDENGQFKLKASTRKTGAVLAKHFVTVLPGRDGDTRAGEQEVEASPALAAARKKNPPVPACYKMVKQTPLVIEVTPDKHTYELAMSKNAGPRR